MKMSPSRTSKSKKAMTAFSPKSRTKKTTSPASSIRALPRTKAKVTRAVPERRGMLRGHSSAGRAPAWHAGGRRFDPAWLHHPSAAKRVKSDAYKAHRTQIQVYLAGPPLGDSRPVPADPSGPRSVPPPYLFAPPLVVVKSSGALMETGDADGI